MRAKFVEVINTSGQPFKPAKPGDVGYDLYAQVRTEDQSLLERLISEIHGWPIMIVWPFWKKMVGSGIRLNMMNDTWCRVRARSSTMRKLLGVVGGTIDSGYQGELFTVFINYSFIPRIIRHQERYAQVVFHRATRPVTAEVKEFSTNSIRGNTGFGSTGA